MSDDEIQFEDLAYREPMKARRPDLDPRLACVAYRLPGPDDLPIFLDREPADHIERHALRDVSVELGGILLGKECLDEQTGLPFVWVTKALEAKHYENTQASFTYTHDSWEEITRERDAKFPDLDIVGWYHTHPDFGIFLSSHDLFIHHNFFDQPLQVAYVVDPIRQDRGFFRWKADKMVQVGGFWLTAPRPDRMALARLVNELEGIPTADGGGGGGGMSPRLEAELIAMLSRPQHVAAAPDRGQSAALFSLLGVIAGALAVMAFLFLQALGKNVQDQARQIEALAKGQSQVVEDARKSLADQGVSAKEAALDSLLREIKVQAGPGATARLSEIVAQREEAVKDATRLRSTNAALTEHNVTLEDRLRAQTLEVDEIRQKYEARGADDADLLKSRAAQIDDLKEKLAEQDRLIKDNVSGALQRRYNWAWWFAVAGWVGFAACGVGLISALARTVEDDDRDRRPEPPQHTISIT